jgi:hypothetical protein
MDILLFYSIVYTVRSGSRTVFRKVADVFTNILQYVYVSDVCGTGKNLAACKYIRWNFLLCFPKYVHYIFLLFKGTVSQEMFLVLKTNQYFF